MFAKRGIVEHLARGVGGAGALWVALRAASPWGAFVALAVGLVALRGCPICWIVGLFQTVVASVRGRQSPGACVGGACTRVPRH